MIRFAFEHVLSVVGRFTGRFSSAEAQGKALASLAADPKYAHVSGLYYRGASETQRRPRRETRN
jgi:hypothetical protein